MAEKKKRWYVLRAISGKEAKVKEILDAAIKNSTLGDHVSQVLIPTEKVYATRNGKKVLKDRLVYSGYVFVEAELTGEVIYELRNTTNVIDFLRGRDKGSAPQPLHESDVQHMLGQIDEGNRPVDEPAEEFRVGESVKVTYGPFSGMTGEVTEINADRQKIKVEVKIFGRSTDVELETSQVERLA